MNRFVMDHLIEILGLLVAGLVAVVAFQQLQLQQLQIELQRQRLEYSVFQNLSSSDEQVIMNAEKELYEKMFGQVFKYVQSHPSVSYFEAVHAVLPITVTIPVRPFSAGVSIQNKGKSTANKVRAAFTLNRPITSFQVESVEPFSVIKGGKGESQITIEVDRIVAATTVTITVGSEAPGPEGETGKLVLINISNLSPSQNRGKFYGVASDKFSFLGVSLSSLIIDLPVLEYIPAGPPNVNVVVTSNEGPATRVWGGISTPF